jgi:molybdopterin-guanine dinucleotide biosynthesis protein A
MLGLEAAEQPVAVVVAADMPFVEPDAIHRLLELSTGAQATVLRTQDGLHPLLGVYHRGCLPAIRAAIGRDHRRVTAFWDEVDVRVVDVEDDPFWSRCLFNINSLEDYHRALRVRDDMAGQPATR